jgi:hypothetical protein
MRRKLLIVPVALLSWIALVSISCGDSGGTTGGGGDGGQGPSPECTQSGEACQGLCDDDLGCVECLNDVDCDASAPYCHLGQCDPCESAADCDVGKACAPANHQCEDACATDDDCDGDAPVCDTATGACVGCTSPADCTPARPFCEPTTLQCSACITDHDCGAAMPRCDLEEQSCVACLVDADCSGGVCNDQTCKPGCDGDSDCPAATPKCEQHACKEG